MKEPLKSHGVKALYSDCQPLELLSLCSPEDSVSVTIIIQQTSLDSWGKSYTCMQIICTEDFKKQPNGLIYIVIVIFNCL